MAEVQPTLDESVQQDAGSVDLSRLDENYADAVPMEAFDGEHEIRILEMRLGQKSPDKDPYVLLRLDIPAEPFSKDFTWVSTLPMTTQDDKTRNKNKLRVNAMVAAFQLPDDIIRHPQDAVGATGYAILRKETSEVYGEQSQVREFTLPR